MIILSWVSPIVAPFEMSLDTLKRCFIAWGTYRTSVSFTIFSSCSFMFTEPFSLHFIFCPFPTVTLISHFSTSVMSFFLCVVCDDALLSTNHSSGYCSFFSSCNYPHNVAPTNRLSTSSSFYVPLFSQQSTSLWPLFSHFLYSMLKRGFLAVLFSFMLSFLFLQNADALWPTYHTC